MKPIHFNKEKNQFLKKIRRISFEDIIRAINNGKIIKVINHPNKIRFPNQKIYLIHINDYIYAVPYVETEKELFLKTVYKSTKYTKKYLKVKKSYEKIKE